MTVISPQMERSRPKTRLTKRLEGEGEPSPPLTTDALLMANDVFGSRLKINA